MQTTISDSVVPTRFKNSKAEMPEVKTLNKLQLQSNDSRPTTNIRAGLVLLIAAACALIVANLYYAQPLAGLIGPALGLSAAASGLIVTLTQLGYGAGLLFIVPLGDLHENRRLVLILIGCAILSLLAAAFAVSPVLFLVASLSIGLSSTAVQILVPYASHLTPEESRGRVVGNVMSGLMLGIMLARPVASLIAFRASWHLVFELSAGLLAALALILLRAMPKREPPPSIGYRALLVSMAHIARTTPILQRRALYHAALFGSFSLFWTTVPLLLAGPPFRLTQKGIAWFAFAGVAGAVAAPIAGRVADKGWTRLATGIAMTCVAASFVLCIFGRNGEPSGLALLVAGAVTLDFGVTTNIVLGQRAIYVLPAELRSRLNGLYMATFFVGGAIGSAMGGWAFATRGWNFACGFGILFPILALAYYATEPRT